jgi:hypothetical protein
LNKSEQQAHDLHNYRTEQMAKKQWGITQLYNKFFDEPSSQLYKLHAKLNQLVMQAYGFSPDDDILEKLLALNLELAQKEKRGEPVVGILGTLQRLIVLQPEENCDREALLQSADRTSSYSLHQLVHSN